MFLGVHSNAALVLLASEIISPERVQHFGEKRPNKNSTFFGPRISPYRDSIRINKYPCVPLWIDINEIQFRLTFPEIKSSRNLKESSLCQTGNVAGAISGKRRPNFKSAIRPWFSR